jgi:hypothetical protein
MKERLMEGVLQQRGDHRAVVGADQQVLYLGFYTPFSDKRRDPQGLEPWTIAEARELRDWLTSVLPIASCPECGDTRPQHVAGCLEANPEGVR